MEVIDNFEEFLLVDLSSKIFPKDELLSEIRKEDWYRTDAFETKKDVEKYIKAHFKVFRKELNNAKTKLNAKRGK